MEQNLASKIQYADSKVKDTFGFDPEDLLSTVGLWKKHAGDVDDYMKCVVGARETGGGFEECCKT